MTYTLPYETTNYKKVYFGGSSVVDYGDFIYYWIIDFNENDQTLIIRTFPLFGAYFDTPMYMVDAYNPENSLNRTAGRVMLDWEEQKWIFEGELDWKPALQ